MPHVADLLGVVPRNPDAPANTAADHDRRSSGVTMTVATDPLLAAEATETIDGILRLIGHVRDLGTRDPLRTLEDQLLELRTAVADG